MYLCPALDFQPKADAGFGNQAPDRCLELIFRRSGTRKRELCFQCIRKSRQG